MRFSRLAAAGLMDTEIGRFVKPEEVAMKGRKSVASSRSIRQADGTTWSFRCPSRCDLDVHISASNDKVWLRSGAALSRHGQKDIASSARLHLQIRALKIGLME